MITAEFQYGPRFLEGFTISGHAEMDTEELGYDIVCAAVSAISLTAALGLKEVLGIPGSYESESGFLQARIGNLGNDRSDAVLRTMLRGLQEIKKQYPDRIQIKESRR